MKKLLSTLCISFGLLFSLVVTTVRADDGNGHDVGYVCIETIETIDCPPNDEPPQQQLSEMSSSNNGDLTGITLTLLELITTLLPKG